MQAATDSKSGVRQKQGRRGKPAAEEPPKAEQATPGDAAKEDASRDAAAAENRRDRSRQSRRDQGRGRKAGTRGSEARGGLGPALACRLFGCRLPAESAQARSGAAGRTSAASFRRGRMAVVTLGEAARLPGLGKTTLVRAIGLARVYPFPFPTVAADTTVTATGPARSPSRHQSARARLWRWSADSRIAEVGELLRRQLDDVWEDRDRWRRQAERLTLTRPPPSRF